MKLEAHDDEVFYKAKAAPVQAYEPQQEDFELIMELKRSKLHFLRSPAPRLSQEQHTKNLLGLFTEEEEFKSSPMRKSVTYSPVPAID
jgi:hypothetical protein